MEITIQKSNQLKAIAILMMLFLHLFNRSYKGLFEPVIFIGSQPLSYYISLFCDACVPIFCFVSGYGLYFKFTKNQSAYTTGNVKRIEKLYINYWIILLLFAVLLGLALSKQGYPGNFASFILNFTALSSSYNGAWWFFFTYILLVASSVVLFGWVNKTSVWVTLSICLLLYIPAFYFRVYRPNLFGNEILNWLQRQVCLYQTSLLPFVAGASALKAKWNTTITKVFHLTPYKNLIAILGILALVALHGIITNFFIAPFLAVPFVFLFAQLSLPAFINKILDFFSQHATNMWLIHMFFYTIYFEGFIYGFRFVLPIFLILVACCVISSVLVKVIDKFILNQIKLS